VLNSANGYQSANYVSDVENRINVEQWMRYMAANTLLDNGETCLANGVGDDYALYRGTNDTRFLALPYDLDTVMGRGLTPVVPRHSIWLMTNLPVMDRFMKTPEFAPLYFKALRTMAETAFSPAQMNPFLDRLLGSTVPQGTIDNMKAYNAGQVDWVLSQIPMGLTVSNNLSLLNSYPRTTTASVPLFGAADAVNTRQVLVNGTPANWSAWQATWSAPAVALAPGINRVRVEALDADGRPFITTYTDIWYDDGSTQAQGGTISSDTTWLPGNGPYDITTSLTIASGATLTIQPGRRFTWALE
jgi:hypothetical protein